MFWMLYVYTILQKKNSRMFCFLVGFEEKFQEVVCTGIKTHYVQYC